MSAVVDGFINGDSVQPAPGLENAITRLRGVVANAELGGATPLLVVADIQELLQAYDDRVSHG